MNRHAIPHVCLLLAALAIVAPAAVFGERTRIGVVIVQSGPLAHIGKGMVNAMVLADEELDSDDKVEFIFEDDGFHPARAVSAAEKLIETDHVAALVTFAGGASAALAPIAEKKGVPLITIAAGDRHTAGRKFVYRQYISTENQVELIAREMKRQRLMKIAVVTTEQESLIRLRDLLVRSAGDSIVADETVLPGDADMRGLATRIMNKRPDAVVLYLLPPQLALFSKSIRELKYGGRFFGGIQLYNFSEVGASNGALVGTIFPSAAFEHSIEGFSGRYLRRFNEPLASDQEVYSYDIAGTLIQAAGRGDIQSYLQSLDQTRGLAGVYPRRDNNFFEVPAALKRIASATSAESVPP